MVQYKVTTRHPTGYNDGEHIFTCHQNHEGSWYATAKGFGCSKNYRSAESAVIMMCHDHACSVVNMFQVETGK